MNLLLNQEFAEWVWICGCMNKWVLLKLGFNLEWVEATAETGTLMPFEITGVAAAGCGGSKEAEKMQAVMV